MVLQSVLLHRFVIPKDLEVHGKGGGTIAVKEVFVHNNLRIASLSLEILK